MEIEGYASGEPCWQDHSSADAARAADFYSALFGWDVAEGNEEYGGYRDATLKGKRVAGISPQMGPGPSVWSTYIKVDDADALTGLVTASGGQVLVPPMDIAPFGRMAFYFDPTGAAIGAWQPAEHTGGQIRNEPGAPTWYELVTSDVAAASTFYSAVFGWSAEDHGPVGGTGGYTEFKLGEKAIGGMMAKPPMMPAEVPSHWAIYFAVEDADATAARATELGGKVIMGPTDIAPGRFAVLADPTGATFNILKSAR